LFISKNPDLDSQERFKVLMSHASLNCSIRTLAHYAQNLATDKFQEWDPKTNISKEIPL